MATAYHKFKTPYYKIYIGDSLGKNMVQLPNSLMRLVEKVEILDSFETISKISITFTEGSREPASPNSSIGTRNLYKTGSSGSRSDVDINLNNRPGLITDLVFSGSGAITFVNAADINSAVSPVVGIPSGTGTDGNVTVNVNPTPTKAPQYLFQERNQIKVTWGYVENPSSVRSIRAQIIMTETEFPEAGQTRTTVTAQSSLAALDQLALNKSINFGQAFRTGRGNEIIDFTDTSTEQMLRDICSKAGIPAIISQNLPSPIMDNGHFKIWIAGESFREFLHRLAEAHNCYYNIITDPNTGIDTLVFIKKTDFESKPILPDGLFDYKQPGTLLKSFNVRADFGMIGGNTQVAIDNKGNVIQQLNQNGKESTVLFNSATDPKSGANQPQVLPDFNPAGNNPNFITRSLAKLFADQTPQSTATNPQYIISGKLENTPIPTVAHLSDRSQFTALDQARAIQVDFTTIGYPKLIPGVIQIGNIGLRYSGKYRVLTVNHVIDSNGYVCRATGTTYSLAQGGTRVPALAGQQSPPQQEAVQLFQPEAQAAPIPRDQVTALQTKQ